MKETSFYVNQICRGLFSHYNVNAKSPEYGFGSIYYDHTDTQQKYLVLYNKRHHSEIWGKNSGYEYIMIKLFKSK